MDDSVSNAYAAVLRHRGETCTFTPATGTGGTFTGQVFTNEGADDTTPSNQIEVFAFTASFSRQPAINDFLTVRTVGYRIFRVSPHPDIPTALLIAATKS